jgi:hypothetical protein
MGHPADLQFVAGRMDIIHQLQVMNESGAFGMA